MGAPLDADRAEVIAWGCDTWLQLPLPSRLRLNVDTSKLIKLPFNDVPSFVGLFATVLVMGYLAKRLPIVKNFT